jgi:threonylcarbamoyladenosine tRNA methylthiotransferase MtaB
VKLYVETHGCRANHYDSEAVLELARRGGYEIVADAESADIAVINTCAVTAEAERDARKSVRRVARSNAAVRTVVTGCSAALPGSRDTLASLPSVVSVIGGADMDALAEALGVAATEGTTRQGTVRAQLRVQDGCDEHCTFCATTLARGANRSRSIDSVVDEARVLAEHHPEMVITGTHIGSYGLDTGSSLGELMQSLVTQVPEVRFRLSSIEASEIDPRLSELLTSDPSRVAPHLHAPLQSGSDRLLKRMGRHWYSAESYIAAVERIVRAQSVFGLGADIIVGFPGETDEDFAMTEAVVRELPFTYLHVFVHSPRAGTAAQRLPDPVPLSVAHDRSHRLRHLAQEKGQAYRKARAGGSADVVVVSSGSEREGLTGDYLTVGLSEPFPRGSRFNATLQFEAGRLQAAPR